MTWAVRTEKLGKRYVMGADGGYQTLRGALRGVLSRRGSSASAREHWALADVDLEVESGAAVAIIGRNGAGKSTLLKILSRIVEPSHGRALVRGRAAALLEVGTGFHPELTGRENVFLNGALLGMDRGDIARRFDEIVAFAGVERFVDEPVKHYSSGMALRLGFSVAAHLEPEVLFVDEVLAVGDVEFQRKCLGKMEEVRSAGRTVLFVSHDLGAVERLCPTAVLIEAGRVSAQGPSRSVVQSYLALMAQPAPVLAERTDRKGSGALRFTAASVEVGGTPSTVAQTGAEARLLLHFHASQACSSVALGVAVLDRMQRPVAFLGTDVTGSILHVDPGDGVFAITMPRLPLLPGDYTTTLFASVGGDVADWLGNAFSFQVVEGDFFGTGKLPAPGYGAVAVPHRIDVER